MQKFLSHPIVYYTLEILGLIPALVLMIAWKVWRVIDTFQHAPGTPMQRLTVALGTRRSPLDRFTVATNASAGAQLLPDAVSAARHAGDRARSAAVPLR